MDWVYKQSTGELFHRGEPVVTPYAVGYAGAGAAKNDPDLQCVSDLGPIPRGWYTIGTPTSHPAPITLPLTPDAANNMCGRAGFLIHADKVQRPGWASEGCIVIKELDKREGIKNSGDRRLEVVA